MAENLVDAVWAKQPALSCAPLAPHPLVFSGERVADKLARVGAQARPPLRPPVPASAPLRPPPHSSVPASVPLRPPSHPPTRLQPASSPPPTASNPPPLASTHCGQVRAAGCGALMLGALDQLCWLFNLRGSDAR